MYMKKIIIAIVLGALLLGAAGGIWYYMNFTKYAPTTYVTDTKDGPITTDTATGETSTTTPIYTQTEIASHKDAASCYTIISGSVYDLTMWVNLHPGGKGAILSLCGIDGTERFMNKHKGGEKYMGILARYKIGVQAQ